MRQSLIDLETAFREADFEAEAVPSGMPFPVDQLLIHLGTDDTGQNYYMQLLFLRDLQNAVPVAHPLTEDDGDLDFLQLYTALPTQLKPSAFPDLARLILIINKPLRAGAFGLHEDDNRSISLRHMIVCPGGKPDAAAVVRTVELMADYLDTYNDVLTQVGTGAATLDEVLSSSMPN